MRPNLMELRQQHRFALNKAESIVQAAETAGRELTTTERQEVDLAMAAVRTLGPQISQIESKSTIRGLMTDGRLILDGGVRNLKAPERHLTEDYSHDFYEYVRSNGQNVGAALYEGSNSAGGYTVPSMVDEQIVPLAPTDTGVRALATVMPTVMDIKLPRQLTISTAALKSEGTGSGSNLFTESDPTLDQFTLSAFMVGLTHTVSWELAQDVPAFQQFAVGDMLLGQSIFEENLYVNGTGTGQAQGLIGNTGAGITGVVAGSDSYASELLNATFSVMGALKTMYHKNASWLMSRATSVTIRLAQKQANLFEPVFVRTGGKDYLHGYPVEYSTALPAVGAASTPILFGDFKLGYVVGDRGGSGINVKILDQPRATEGLIVFLAYRRTDGRVRRSEAIQAISLT